MQNNPVNLHLGASTDESQPFIVRIYDTDKSRKLTYSETYTDKAGAINGGQAIIAGAATYETFKGKKAKNGGEWYFHIQGRNNRILGRSARAYDSEIAAGLEMELVRAHVGNAEFYDDTV